MSILGNLLDLFLMLQDWGGINIGLLLVSEGAGNWRKSWINWFVMLLAIIVTFLWLTDELDTLGKASEEDGSNKSGSHFYLFLFIKL